MVNSRTQHPLTTNTEEQASDHNFISYHFRLQHRHDFSWIRYRVRQISDAAILKYDKMIKETDWSFDDKATISSVAADLHKKIADITNECFPYKHHKVRSTDDPWIDDAVRQKIRFRKRIFSREIKRTKEWHDLKKITDMMIKRRKQEYYKKECEKLKQKGAHQMPYKALKALSLAERPPSFDPSKIKPHLTDQQLADDLAEYFAGISAELPSLNTSAIPKTYDRPILDLTVEQVTEKLTQLKKPKSSVTIDPLSRFVNAHAALFAPTLTHIINGVRNGQEWPSIWSQEEVSIIPKGQNVTDYSGCRNISCTSIFSKLCETFLLEDLTAEVTLTGPQFGGIKGSGPPQLLAELMTSSLEQLDDNRAAVTTVSLDFEKAFNRMDHTICCRALASRGASNQTITMTQAFLRNRTMRVKVKGLLSKSLPTPGGAPQGTKCGNFLFCVAVDGIQSADFLPRVLGGPPPPFIRQPIQPCRPPLLSPASPPPLPAAPPSPASSISRYGLPPSPEESLSLRHLHEGNDSSPQRDWNTGLSLIHI